MKDTPTIALEPELDIGRLRFDELIGLADRLRPLGQAATIYQQWLAARHHSFEPVFAAWFNLGVELGADGDAEAAAACYRSALALRPDFHQAAINLGLLTEKRDPDAALAIWTQATQSDDARTALLNQRARLCEQLGRLEEAERLLGQSLAITADQPDAIQHWVHLRQKLCLWPTLSTGISGLTPDRLLHQAGPLAALALTDDVAVQRDVARRWVDRKTYPVEHPLAPSRPYGHERIRIGYMSSDFCRHALSYLIAELFETHDRTRFTIYGYCTTNDDGSPIRRRILDAFDEVRMIRNLSDNEAAQLIRSDEIDILIDLNGLTAGSRMQILRNRPAPVQATYLGFVGPVPLPELDYMFCDDQVIPPASAAQYAPTPLAIAENYQANDGKREIGRAMSRQEACLPLDRFIFACFSNHYKITEAMFGHWMSILLRSPDSSLWLCADQSRARNNMRQAAQARGVDPERLVFADRVEPGLYMSRLRLADLFLDTFPYNAGTIASDAIRMGLPLLTRSGRSFASRMAGSMLRAVGADAGITESDQHYVDLAVALATDRDRYLAYQQHFTPERWRQSIGHTVRFTQSLELKLMELMQHQKVAR